MPTAQGYMEPENYRFARCRRIERDTKEGTPVAVGSTRPEPVHPMDQTGEPSARRLRSLPPRPTLRANPGKERTRPLSLTGALEAGKQCQDAPQIHRELRARAGELQEARAFRRGKGQHQPSMAR
jgi:hypothetical protein